MFLGFIAVTLWVECYRLLPKVPRERRIAFTHGLGCGLVTVCMVATTLGYGLAAKLPPLFAAAILLLTLVGGVIADNDRARCPPPPCSASLTLPDGRGDITWTRR